MSDKLSFEKIPGKNAIEADAQRKTVALKLLRDQMERIQTHLDEKHNYIGINKESLRKAVLTACFNYAYEFAGSKINIISDYLFLDRTAEVILQNMKHKPQKPELNIVELLRCVNRAVDVYMISGQGQNNLPDK